MIHVFATGVAPDSRFAFVASILEGIETGSSKHCLYQLRDASNNLVQAAHWRLDVTISFA